MNKQYDIAGWATKNDILCADGRTIRDGAFKENDGQTVPLVYMHQHRDPSNVLGHALLENRPGEGVYCYASFNQNSKSQEVKHAVEHGDLTAFSIYANDLEQVNGNVTHGRIREVSLVLSGANDGAVIDYPVLAHSGEIVYDEAVIYASPEGLDICHSDEGVEKAPDETAKEDKMAGNEKTVKDVLDTMTDEQKKAMYFIIASILEEEKKAAGSAGKDTTNTEDSNGGKEMKHSIFDTDNNPMTVLSHSDMVSVLNEARRTKTSSLRELMEDRFGGDVIAHAYPVPTTGMTTATGTQDYGFNDPEMLFPEYHNLNNPPEWISREMGWVSKVMSGVHHTPFSRIKSQYANITEDEARAKGYIKGKQKKTEVFTTLKRTTDPQTIYKLQKLDRDDTIDITDFDVVAWIKAEMRTMLDEEIARAILIGDGRLSDDEFKISEEHVRPIATDVPLFNTKVDVTTESGASGSDKAKELINSVIRARKDYKGSGNPTFFTTEDWVTECLLLEDGIGHKLYKSVAELATAMRVKDIVTVEAMEGYTVDDKPLIGVIVNLSDYNVGADKGGSVNTFEDFDIDFNQYKYLIETRISGALIKPYSALTILDAEA